MIKVHNGHVEIEGTGETLLAEYACITNVLVDKMNLDAVLKCFVIGAKEKINDDMIWCIDGRVDIPENAKKCTLNLAMILNAIVEQCGDNSESIIKTAADIAMIIKPDKKTDDIEQIGRQVEKLLKGVEDV